MREDASEGFKWREKVIGRKTLDPPISVINGVITLVVVFTGCSCLKSYNNFV